MNLQETHILRKLDETVLNDGEAIVGTNYGNVTVRKTGQTFVAIAHNSNFDLSFCDSCPSAAFLKLAAKLKSK